MTAVICAAIKTSSNFVYTIISQNHPDGGLNTSYTTYVKSPCYHYVAKRLTSQIEVRHICKIPGFQFFIMKKAYTKRWLMRLVYAF